VLPEICDEDEANSSALNLTSPIISLNEMATLFTSFLIFSYSPA